MLRRLTLNEADLERRFVEARDDPERLRAFAFGPLLDPPWEWVKLHIRLLKTTDGPVNDCLWHAFAARPRAPAARGELRGATFSKLATHPRADHCIAAATDGTLSRIGRAQFESSRG
jgi:hypothetical protein